MKKTILILVISLVLIQTALAGVTNPLPSNMELLQGESGRFKFQIQAVNSDNDQTCTYGFEGEPLFLVDFDSDSVNVAAGGITEVQGTVEVPENITFGQYISEFCVSCLPEETQSGANVQVETCGIPLVVSVVPERTRENLYVPEKDKSPIGLIIVIILVVIAIIVALYLLLREPKRSKSRPIVVRSTVKKPARKKTTKKKVTKRKTTRKRVAKKKTVRKKKRK